MTLEQAKLLKRGQIIYATFASNSDGTPARYRVNGEVHVWKKSPERIRVPLKHGLYDFANLTENNLEAFNLSY